MKVPAAVKFSSVKNCLAHVSSQTLYTVANKQESENEIVVAKVVTNNGNCYFSLVPFAGPGNDNELRINGLYANKLAIKNDGNVFLEHLHNVPVCISASIEPMTTDDWEILELHASEVEMHLLDQLRVVWPGQIFPLWVDRNVCIYMRVVKTEPLAECSTLMHLSELIIEPKVAAGPLKAPAPVVSTAVSTLPCAESQKTNSGQDTEENENNSDDELSFRFKLFCRLYNAVKFIVVYIWKQLLPNIFAHLRSLLFFNSPMELPTEIPATDSLLDKLSKSIDAVPENFNLVIRVEPFEHMDLPSTVSFIYEQPNTVFLHLSNSNPDRNSVLCYVVLTKLMSPTEKLEADIKTSQVKGKSSDLGRGSELPSTRPSCVVRMYVHPQSKFAMSCDITNLHHLKVPLCLRRQMQIGNCSKVRLRKLDQMLPFCDKIYSLELQVVAYTHELKQEDLKDVTHWFRQWIDSVCDVDNPLPMAVGTLLYFPSYSFSNEGAEIKNELEVVVTDIFLSASDNSEKESNQQTYLLCPDDLLKLKLNFKVSKVQYLLDVDPSVPLESVLLHCDGMETQVAALGRCLELGLKTRPLAATLLSNVSQTACVLVTGSKGTGKSTLCNAILRKFGTDPSVFAFTTVLNCSKLCGKKPDNVKRKLKSLAAELLWKQPSVLLLDDLDQLATARSTDEDKTSDAIYSMHMAVLVQRCLKALFLSSGSTSSRVAVLVTSKSKNTLHPLLTCVTDHLFTKHIHIDLPNKVQRSKMLSSIIRIETDFSVPPDMDIVVEKTEGFAVADLVKVVKRSCHLSQVNRATNAKRYPTNILRTQHMIESLNNFVPVSLQNARLHKPSPLKWNNVGGLHSVKQSLMEQLVWPLKYQHVFDQVGLQAQSGIMLFGPPGCGKTLVAGVVANECGLNFISVKGPELLSKYIGASEAAVRDLFSRARAAAPCVLFFDEFDSLAPPRGHDSTGVTDRVVNQLLTHLDGVEPLVGVTVMAASSRPDLLDQALLRPGRLDNLLYLPLPDEAERLEILHSLSAHLPLQAEVDLGELSKCCENFSGADLKALLYNAQLDAVHELCEVPIKAITSPQDSIHAEFQLYSLSPSESPTLSSSSTVGLELDMYQCNGLVAAGDPVQGPMSLPLSNDSVADLKRTAAQLITSIQEVNMNPSHSQLQYDDDDFQICFDEVKNRNTPDNDDINPVRDNDFSDIAYYPSLHSGRSLEIPTDVVRSVRTIFNTYKEVQTDRIAEKQNPRLVITQKHIRSALASTRPSLTPAERVKLENLYASFVRSRDRSSFNKPDYYQGKQRVTLS